jgi:hypothetical protein
MVKMTDKRDENSPLTLNKVFICLIEEREKILRRIISGIDSETMENKIHILEYIYRSNKRMIDFFS